MATTSTSNRTGAPGGGTNGRNGQPPRTPGKARRRPKKRGAWHKIKSVIQVVSLFIVVCLVTVLGTIWYQLRQVPKTIELQFNPPGRTLIYSSDGMLLAKLFTENRQVVPLDQIPKDLQHATVAFEDKRFYKHQGVDLQGIGRALRRNIRNGDMKGEGGSTITQQLARNLGVGGLTREKSIQRKIHEWIVANQIEHSKTKDEILEMYLNQINYGSGAFGVQAAAQTYFAKNVKDLDLAQCALLAGLPNRPSYYSPYKDKKVSELQRNRVLDEMKDQGYITADQWAKARSEYIHLASAKPPAMGSQIERAPYFVNYVIDQLKTKYGEQYILDGNLRVTTTLNWAMQQAAEEAVRAGIARAGAGGPTQACLVAIDPKNGEIKAMVGGADYKKSQFNIVTQARRQPGSTFKAIVYSAAIDSGAFSEGSTILDAPFTLHLAGGPWTPRDDAPYSYRSPTIRKAFANSINVPAVRVLDHLGVDNVIRYATLMGIQSKLARVPSLALGSSGVTPLEITSAYGTFAAGGDHATPMAFNSVTDNDGKVIEDIAPEIATHILQPGTVQQIDDMARAVVTEGTASLPTARAQEVPDAHGKTGTTQSHRDVWFVGYTHDLACGVWAGRPVHNKKTGEDSYGEEMRGNAWGATICAPIWSEFMLKAGVIMRDARARSAAKGAILGPPVTVSTEATNEDNNRNGSAQELPAKPKDDGKTTAPSPAAPVVKDNGDGTVTVNLDDNTNLLAPPNAPHSHRTTFAKGSEPTEISPEYQAKPGATPAAASPVGTASGGQPEASPVQPETNAGGASPAASGTLRTGGQTTVPPTGRMGAHDPDSPTIAAHPIDGTDTPPANPTLTRHRRQPAPPAAPQTVTVRINPEDGLLATKWDPEVIEKVYIKGTEPHRYSHMYKPPPGEH